MSYHRLKRDFEPPLFEKHRFAVSTFDVSHMIQLSFLVESSLKLSETEAHLREREAIRYLAAMDMMIVES